MNIEIANRLVELRKKNGLSQEELADKLGLSRQAVSKWERAESSPDTDNLICLAKLYNVSLDDLLKTDQDIEEISLEVREKEESKESDEDDEVELISEEDKKRNEKFKAIDAVLTGICFSLALFSYILFSCIFPEQWGKLWVLFFVPIIVGSILDCIRCKRFSRFAYPVLATFIFLTIGVYTDIWHPTWVVFPFIPLYYAIFNPIDSAIAKNKNK